jgi:prepilin-type N-terminal cleavage/methylation domain-containing protein
VVQRSSESGFTLIELMISIAIIGLMSAAAIPIMVKYMARAKTGEASTMIQKIYVGARLYYLEERTKPGQIEPVPKQFPAGEPLTPAATCCALGGAKCAPRVSYWKTPSWQALGFSVDDPAYYQYGFESGGIGLTSTFQAIAVGDLDCDAILSTFTMFGSVNGSGEISGQAAISRINEME